jgi:hypothetical protein
MKRALFSFIILLAASAAASAQSFTYYFPQIAAGDGWRTTIFVSNATASGMASGSITFTKSDSSPFNANWTDEVGNNVSNGGSVISFQLAAGQSRKFVTVGDLPLTVGYAMVTANASVLGTAMYSQLDASGNILAEAGVPMGIPLGKQAIFVDTSNGFRTGVAIANPNSNTLVIHFELVDDNGQVLAAQIRELPGFQHMALFTDELFAGAPAMVGRMQFWCTNPMVAIALRFSPSIQFTTMPPIAIAN